MYYVYMYVWCVVAMRTLFHPFGAAILSSFFGSKRPRLKSARVSSLSPSPLSALAYDHLWTFVLEKVRDNGRFQKAEDTNWIVLPQFSL